MRPLRDSDVLTVAANDFTASVIMTKPGYIFDEGLVRGIGMDIHSRFKYVRIQGKSLASNTLQGKGIFSLCWQLVQNSSMEQEDADLFVEIDSWFAEHLPWPPQCKRQEPVVCWFKTENSEEMLKMIVPALWLLDRYEVPYYLVYSNTPGEIVYEDRYQIAAMAGEALQIEDLQPSWSPEDQ